MSEENMMSERDVHTNETLAMPVMPDSDLKSFLVEYVGNKIEAEEVTVNMIAEVLASDFPEFTYSFAEENFLRGYQTGLDDAEKLFIETAGTATENTD
jgi:hypothetical protein